MKIVWWCVWFLVFVKLSLNYDNYEMILLNRKNKKNIFVVERIEGLYKYELSLVDNSICIN